MFFWKKDLSLGEIKYKGGVLPRQEHLLQGMEKWLQENWEECQTGRAYNLVINAY